MVDVQCGAGTGALSRFPGIPEIDVGVLTVACRRVTVVEEDVHRAAAVPEGIAPAVGGRRCGFKAEAEVGVVRVGCFVDGEVGVVGVARVAALGGIGDLVHLHFAEG